MKEITAPYGYVLNSEAQLVELAYAGQEVTVRDTVNTAFVNNYQGVEIALEKVMENDELFGISAENCYTNVRFGLFAAEEITAADGSSIPEDGLIAEVSLNENMKAVIAEKIPFAKYYVQEIATDEHYILNGEKYAVFVGVDENGVPRQAHKRGTATFGKSFRQTVEGSDTKYSFSHSGI